MVAAGRVEIVEDGNAGVAGRAMLAGDCVGEAAALAPQVPPARARAAEPVSCLLVPASGLADLIERDVDVAEAVIAALLGRVRRLSEREAALQRALAERGR